MAGVGNSKVIPATCQVTTQLALLTNILGQILSGEPKAYQCNCYKVVSFHQLNGAISHDTMKGSVVIWGCSRTSPTSEETHVETRDDVQRRKYFLTVCNF